MTRKQRITMKIVRAALAADDYQAAKELGAAAIPFLGTIIDEGEPLMSEKAVYLAGLLNAEGSPELLERAARSRKATMQASVAAATAHLASHAAVPILSRLLRSRHASVRKWAMRSIPEPCPAELALYRDEKARQKTPKKRK